MTQAEKVEATRYRCGDPKCETAHVVADDEVGPGYTMNVIVPDASRSTAGRTVGRDVEVYACQIAHVRGAVDAATAPIRRPDGGKPGKAADDSAGSSEPAETERRSDEEEAALEDGYDGPMPGEISANGAEPAEAGSPA